MVASLQLVATGEEYAPGILEGGQAVSILTIPAGLEVEDVHSLRAQLPEERLVALTGVGKTRGGRDHDDARIAPAAEPHEPLQDEGAADLRFGAANRDDETAHVALQ